MLLSFEDDLTAKEAAPSPSRDSVSDFFKSLDLTGLI